MFSISQTSQNVLSNIYLFFSQHLEKVYPLNKCDMTLKYLNLQHFPLPLYPIVSTRWISRSSVLFKTSTGTYDPCQKVLDIWSCTKTSTEIFGLCRPIYPTLSTMTNQDSEARTFIIGNTVTTIGLRKHDSIFYILIL